MLEANIAAFRAGYNFGETAELFDHPYEVKPAQLRAGRVPQHHRQRRAVVRARRGRADRRSCRSFYASYPITPASDILHELSKLKNFGVKTLQAEDEIAAAGVAIGAAFAGSLAITGTSGPGVDLKSEAIGLAISLELPMLHRRRAARRPVDRPADQDRAGRPACSRCTAGTARRRCRSSPRSSPADCFDAAFEAVRIALKYRTPVILLTDGYLANGAEPWNAARPRRAARHLGAVRDRAEPRRRVLAVPARSRDAGAAVGDSRHAAV